MPKNTLRDLCPLTASFLDASTEAAATSRLVDGEEAILAVVREAARQGLAPFFAPDVCDLELAPRRVEAVQDVVVDNVIGRLEVFSAADVDGRERR